MAASSHLYPTSRVSLPQILIASATNVRNGGKTLMMMADSDDSRVWD